MREKLIKKKKTKKTPETCKELLKTAEISEDLGKKPEMSEDLGKTPEMSEEFLEQVVPDLSVVLRSNGHKLKHQFHLNIGKNFFTLRVAELWKSCPGILSETSQTHLDVSQPWDRLLLSFWGQPWVLSSGIVCVDAPGAAC